VFTNNEQGYQQFIDWIESLFANDKPLICMEVTGAYSLPLAEFMVNQNYTVSVVNPAKIKAFAGSELSRTKTDKADVKLIARYAITMQPSLWTPP
jgi:transposase